MFVLAARSGIYQVSRRSGTADYLSRGSYWPRRVVFIKFRGVLAPRITSPAAVIDREEWYLSSFEALRHRGLPLPRTYFAPCRGKNRYFFTALLAHPIACFRIRRRSGKCCIAAMPFRCLCLRLRGPGHRSTSGWLRCIRCRCKHRTRTYRESA